MKEHGISRFGAPVALVAILALLPLIYGSSDAGPVPPDPAAGGHRTTVSSAYWTNITLNSTGEPNGSIVFDAHDTELVSSTMSYRDGQWSPNGGPGGNALAYDPAIRSGGVVAVNSNASIWFFQSGHWSWFNTTGTGPVAASALIDVYDAADGYLVAIDSGDAQNITYCNWGSATWPGDSCAGNFSVWSLSSNLTWAALPSLPTHFYAPDPNGGGVLPYFSPVVDYDAAAGYVVAVNSGGDTYSYSAGKWANRGQNIWLNVTSGNAGVESGGALAFDPQLNGSILFGGACSIQSWHTDDYSGDPCPLEGGKLAGYNSTWMFRSGNWTNISGPTDPTPRAGFSMGFDGADGYLLVTGGTYEGENATTCCDGTPVPNLSNQTWAFSDQPVIPPSPVNGVRVSGTPNPSDVGTPVRLSVRFQGGHSPFTYRWSNETSSWTTTVNLSSTSWTTPGPHRLTVSVSDAAGTNQSASANFTIHAVPVIDIRYVVNETVGIAEPFNVSTFNGTEPYGYSWSFGDGSNSTSRDAAHAYSSPGAFPIALNATDEVGQFATAHGRVYVASAIVVGLNVSNTTPSLGQSIWFNASTSGGVGPFTYQWSGLPIPCVTQDSPTIGCLPAESGNFSVTVHVTDNHPGGANASSNVSVVFDFTIVVSTSAAPLGQSVRIVVLSTASGLNFAYQGLPLGCVSKNTPQLVCTPTQAGNFTIKVTATDGSGNSKSRTCNLEVLGLSPRTGPSTLPSQMLWPWILVGVLLGAAAVLLISRATRSPISGPGTGDEELTDMYAGFRGKVPPPEGGSAVDPIDELF